MSNDYYNLLGVDKGASQDEIKKAYRKLAHEHHPDKETGDEAKFKEINEAYQVLSDEQKRSTYDQFGSAGVNGAAGGGPGGANWEDVMRQAQSQGGFGGGHGVEFDLGDIFSEFFGGGGRRGGRQAQKGQDIQMDMELDFKEAAFGTKKSVTLYKGVKCDHCSGNGAEPGTPIESCETCNGQGVVEQMTNSVFGQVRRQAVCPKCAGEGKTFEDKCKTCSGNGVEKKETEIEIDIPAGVDVGQTIRVPQQGEAGPRGATPGDLFVTVDVKPEAGWKRHGDDIFSELELPYTTMVFGDTVGVKTLDGDVDLKIPAGTASGTQMRLRGKGVQKLQRAGRGDHYVTVKVAVPKKPSGKLKKVLKELSQLGG